MGQLPQATALQGRASPTGYPLRVPLSCGTRVSRTQRETPWARWMVDAGDADSRFAKQGELRLAVVDGDDTQRKPFLGATCYNGIWRGSVLSTRDGGYLRANTCLTCVSASRRAQKGEKQRFLFLYFNFKQWQVISQAYCCSCRLFISSRNPQAARPNGVVCNMNFIYFWLCVGG